MLKKTLPFLEKSISNILKLRTKQTEKNILTAFKWKRKLSFKYYVWGLYKYILLKVRPEDFYSKEASEEISKEIIVNIFLLEIVVP